MNIKSILGNQKRLMLIMGFSVAILVIFMVVFIMLNISSDQTDPDGKAKLEFWGVFDDKQVMRGIVDQFEQNNKNINITYTLMGYEEYEDKLINAFASGSGPDIVMIHDTWLPKHKNKLSPMPDGIGYTDLASFKSEYVDTVYDELVADGKIFAVPLYVDTLALYYNKDMFNTAQITRPPVTWDEFSEYIEKLTRIDDDGNILQSGAAIGSARNVNRSVDILMNMMIQSGVQMNAKNNGLATFASPVNRENVGERTLEYYTDFTNPIKHVYSWNDNQHYSVDAFIEGSAAMMFNYSYQIPVIKSKAPRLNFGVAPMPQSDINNVRTYPNYWALGVSKQSKNQTKAWKFVQYITSPDVARSYLSQTQRPAAQREIIDQQRNLVDLGVFATQGLSAKSWYQFNNTAVDTIFADMIDDVNFGRRSVKDALENAQSKINTLLR